MKHAARLRNRGPGERGSGRSTASARASATSLQASGRNPLSQRGFTLLEAIVALVILTAALAGAWTWVANDVRAIGRVRDLALEEAAVQQAVAELEQIDLAQQPEGTLRWRDYRVDWQANVFEAPRRGRTRLGVESNYQFALFDVALVVLHGERVIGTPALRMLQYHATSPVDDDE